MNPSARTPLPKIPYDAERIGLKRIFESPTLSGFACRGIASKKIEQVYGALNFPEPPADRPYLFASMVLSLDGKIAFEDAPEGPLIAQTNLMDKDGAAADFWFLNALRASSDATMGFGGGFGRKKEDSVTAAMFGTDLESSGHIFDQDLEDDRIAAGRAPVPWQIITSLDGSEINFDHPFLNNHPLIPFMVTTGPTGLDRLRSRCKARYFVVDDPSRVPASIEGLGMPVIVTGEASMPDAAATMRILRKLGMKRVLIEGPSYCHHLIRQGLIDELFLNYSCLYVGGKALSLGGRSESFTSTKHPHTEMLSIHSHGPHFFYFRHKLIY